MSYSHESNPTVITKDMSCENCGYSLKGLYTDASCPECGTPIRKRSAGKGFSDNLVDAPIGYIRFIAYASAATAGGALMVTLGLALLWVYRLPGVAIAALLGPILYAGGVFVVTSRRPRDSGAIRDELLDSKWIRWAARITQACWPGAMILSAVLPLSSIPGWAITAGGWIGAVLIVVGFLGLLPLCLFLSGMAQWAGEDSLSDRFRTAGVLTGGLGLLSLILDGISRTPTLLAAPAGLLGFIASILSAIGVLLLVACLLQFALMCGWAVNNWTEVRERDARVDAKRRERERELAERAARASDAANIRGPAQAVHISKIEHRVSRASEEDTPLPVVGDETAEPLSDPEGLPEREFGNAASDADGVAPERSSAESSSTKPRRYANEVLRERAQDVTPYGLEPDEDD